MRQVICLFVYTGNVFYIGKNPQSATESGYLSGIGGVGAGVLGRLPRETTGERMPTDCSDADEPLNGDGSGDAVLARSLPLHSESEYWMLWYS